MVGGIMAEARNNSQQSKPGILARWFSRLATMITWLFFGILMSIASEWIGMNISWPEQGINHSKDMLEKEIGYVNKDFRNSLLISNPVVFTKQAASSTYKWVFVKTGIENFILKSRKKRRVDSALTSIEKYVISAMYITQVIAVRITIMILALPAFFIFAAVASVEGLVQRDIRRWELGREHSGLYHYAKRSVPFFFVAPWVIYLAIPYSVHPNMVVLPFALFFGIGVFMTTYLFKKYI
tara:strand:+ start:36993 stop:37709 length:717 start_codon:yes stop_codon:yes gene_type:complete